MDALIVLLLSYVVGVVSSRIGSLILEPTAKKLNILKWRDYSRYLEAEREDEKLQTLQTVSNMYRSLAGCLVLLLAVSALYAIIPNTLAAGTLMLAFCFVLFVFAWRKQTNYIVKRIDKWTTTDGGNDKEE